ncbi:MAG: DNA translocase FtsK [Candidatus Ozemobacteraceae bacterium]
MSSKKLLLPEIRPRLRKSTSSKAGRTSFRGTSSPNTGISSRQRNEAVGLALIGVSTAFFAVLHFFNPPAIAGIVRELSVFLGLGIYILPCVLALMGIQRFCEKPFLNPGWRLIGTFGALIFGLGLLGLEGGKLGASAFQIFSSKIGIVPSKLLFFFFTLSSLVFALDIVYKDLLLGLLLFIRTTFQALHFSWELVLTLLAMLIESCRTTINFVVLIASSIQRLFQNEEAGETSHAISGMLPLPPMMTEHGPAAASPGLSSQFAPPSYNYDDREGIPDPVIWRDALDSETVEIQPCPSSKQTPPPPAEAQKNPPQAGNHLVADAFNTQVRGIPHIVCVENTSSIPMFVFPTAVPPTPPQEKASHPQNASHQFNLAGVHPGVGTHPQNALQQPCNFDGRQPGEGIPPLGKALEKSKPLPNEESTSFEKNAEQRFTEEVVDIPECLPDVESSFREIDEDEGEDVPVSLEDNSIDKNLKSSRGGGTEQTPPSPPREVLLPPLDLLTVPLPHENQHPSDLADRSALLLKVLEDFGIKAQITAVVEGPAVSRFELKPAPGIKVARITSLTDDIALALSAMAIRIEAPIPGKPALGIEIPNSKPTPVFFYDLVKNERFKTSETILNLALGVTISGRPVFADLTDMPHLLIAGSTGSGKSVCVNTIIASILFQARADQVKMIMIDPKMVELSSYNGIPHLISPVVTDPKKASAALLWAVEEMERRYELLASCRVRKISTYNEDLARLQKEFDVSLTPMPYVVIIIDELADLMMTASAEVEGSICRLAQMARAVGIHLVIATQRPSVDVLTGIIKANLPSRIAFSVASHIDSRTILDTKGAEKLLGKGDMLFVPKGRNKPLRLQGAFISDHELMAITEFAKSQGEPEYLDIAPQKEDDDEEDSSASDDVDINDDQRLLLDIENYLATQEKTSTSMLQRRFKIGYNRAARTMDLLEQKGMVSPLDGANKRRVIGKRSNP